jgi:hypothetical protein
MVIGTWSANNIHFVTNGSTSTSDAMVLDINGNMGLGVTPSVTWTSPFKVIEGGGGTYQSWLGFQSNGNAFKLGTNSYWNGSGYGYKNTDGAVMFGGQSDVGFTWLIAPSGTAGNTIPFTQAMTLDASGRLWLGTTSGSTGFLSTLDSSSLNIGFTFSKSGSYQGSIGIDTGGSIISGSSAGSLAIRSSAGPLLFSTGGSGAEVGRFDNAGNLLLGTTNTTGSMSNGQVINAGGLRTMVGSFAAPSSGSWTSIATITQAGMYLVHAYIAGYVAGPGNWSGCFLVTATGTVNPAYVYTLVSGNIQCQVVSTNTIQIYIGSGSGTTVQWVIARIG